MKLTLSLGDQLLRQTKLWSNVHLVVSEEIGIPDNLTGRGQVSKRMKTFWYHHSHAPLFQSKETPNLLVYTPIPLPIVLIESLYPTFTISLLQTRYPQKYHFAFRRTESSL